MKITRLLLSLLIGTTLSACAESSPAEQSQTAQPDNPLETIQKTVQPKKTVDKVTLNDNARVELARNDSGDNLVYINTDQEEVITSLENEKGSISNLKHSPNQEYFYYSLQGEGSLIVYLHESDTGKQLKSIETPTQFQFTSDSSYLYTCGINQSSGLPFGVVFQSPNFTDQVFDANEARQTSRNYPETTCSEEENGIYFRYSDPGEDIMSADDDEEEVVSFIFE